MQCTSDRARKGGREADEGLLHWDGCKVKGSELA